MRILQISDFHLRGDGRLSFRVVDTKRSLEVTLAHLNTVMANPAQRPDLIVVTGDLADSGDAEAYRMLYRALSGLGVPVYAVPGNHDRRDRMRELLPGWSLNNPETAPCLSYTVDFQGVHLLMLDTMAPGSHSGHCSKASCQWLDRELQAKAGTPTLLFMHHPPFVTGMGAMDEPYENVEMLREVISRAPWVRLCCGHMHRSISTLWAGAMCVTAPSAAMQIDLDFSRQGGDTFVMEAPGYLLHDFEDGQWNTHVCQIYGQYKYDGPYPFADKVNPVES